MASTNRNQNPIYLAYSDKLERSLFLQDPYAGMIGKPEKEHGEFVPAPIRVPQIVPAETPAPTTPSTSPVEVPAEPIEVPAST